MTDSGKVILSGMRPTGRLHLGHLEGALKNYLRFQDGGARCFFMVADWHALTSEYANPRDIRANTRELLLDWLAVGIDPDRATVFVQSDVPEHAELFVVLSMLTPLPWAERCPTYKEQQQELQDKDLATYGFLGYPILQAADILLYRASHVPIGADQLPHLEMTREIARRFNYFYAPGSPVLPEPESVLTEAPRVPGLDGRKMSKSYSNAVFLSDPAPDIERKLSRMMTDPRRVRRTDPGEPGDCPAFNLHQVYCTPDEIEYVMNGCRTAGIGCLDCKRVMIKHVLADLGPIRERRAELENHPEQVTRALERGNEHARAVAATTMHEARGAMGLDED